MAGDFNSVTKAEEVSNAGKFDKRRCSGFNDWIFGNGLIDMGFIGPKFTWIRGRSPSAFKGARLDSRVHNLGRGRGGYDSAEESKWIKIGHMKESILGLL